MKKVSYDKFDEYASTFEPGFNLLEEQLKRREAMALKLADLLNEKIDECEKRKACEVNLAVQLSAKIDECEELKKEVAILRDYARGLNHRLDMESFQGKGAQ